MTDCASLSQQFPWLNPALYKNKPQGLEENRQICIEKCFALAMDNDTAVGNAEGTDMMT